MDMCGVKSPYIKQDKKELQNKLIKICQKMWDDYDINK